MCHSKSNIPHSDLPLLFDFLLLHLPKSLAMAECFAHLAAMTNPPLPRSIVRATADGGSPFFFFFFESGIIYLINNSFFHVITFSNSKCTRSYSRKGAFQFQSVISTQLQKAKLKFLRNCRTYARKGAFH